MELQLVFLNTFFRRCTLQSEEYLHTLFMGTVCAQSAARPRAAQEAMPEPAACCVLERHRRGIAASIFPAPPEGNDIIQ